jgi:hypothetical protein
LGESPQIDFHVPDSQGKNFICNSYALKTLALFGKMSISQATTVTAVTFADGSTSTTANVILTNNQIDTRYLGDNTVSAAVHTNLHGYDTVKSLGCGDDQRCRTSRNGYKFQSPANDNMLGRV